MRIAKCLVIILVSAAVFGAEQQISNTRDASCLVRITANPGIVPLNPQTVKHLVLSSGVAGKAAKEVLGFDAGTALHLYEGIQVEWLAQSTRQIGQRPMPGERGRQTTGSTGQSRDEGYDDMMRQLAEIYGDRYMKQSSPKDSTPEKDSNQWSPPGMMMGGGMMGGMIGGGGMGGYGGGMGGYGDMYGGGMYGGGLRQAVPATGAQQSATLRLSVHLPEDVKPVAEEFLAALMENLRQALLKAYERQSQELRVLVDFAESRRQEAETNVDIAMAVRTPESMLIQQQLDTIVELSMLAPEMPFAEAIETLRNVVEPPLQIVVLWKELLDCCEIEPTTPIDMDGLPRVKLKTALRTLLEAVGGGFTDISYQIDDDVIVIREEESHQPQRMPAKASVEADLGALTAQRRDLARRLRQLEMDFATGDARRKAIEEQIAEVRHQAMQKLENDVVTRELESLVEMSTQSASLLQRQVESGRASGSELTQARQNLTKARIDLAMRREELAKSIGGNRLSQLNDELGRMAIDTAEKRAEMEITRAQLAETKDQLARASTFDPRAVRIRIARETLDVAAAQVTRLKTRLARLQPPMVTVIGAN